MSFYPVLNSSSENPLYIDGEEILLDGYDYEKITNKVIDVEIEKLGDLEELPYGGYSGNNSSAYLNNNQAIYSQIYKESEINVLPSGVCDAIDGLPESLGIGDTVEITNWSYTSDQWSYHITEYINNVVVWDADIDSVVVSYDPEEYNLNNLTSGLDYFNNQLTANYRCVSQSSSSVTLIKIAMPSEDPSVSGYYLYKYEINNDDWVSTNISLQNAKSFCAFGNYIYYLETIFGVTYLKRTNGSTLETIISNIPDGQLLIIDNSLCLFSNKTVYLINNGSYSQYITTNYQGVIISNSEGIYLFSVGMGIYSYKNDQWIELDYLDSSFNRIRPIVVNDLILFENWGILYYFDENTGLSELYTFDEPLNSVVPIYDSISNFIKLYAIGTTSDSNLMECYKIIINDIRYDTEYIKPPRNSAFIRRVNSTKSWAAKSDLGFTPGKIIACVGHLYAVELGGVGFKEYSISRGEWISRCDLPYPVGDNPCLVVKDADLYLLGSATKTGYPTSTCDTTKSKYIYVYNDFVDSWSRFKKGKSYINCPYPVFGSAAIEYDGDIHLFGGTQGNSSGAKRYYIYNGKKWVKNKQQLPFECYNGKAFIFKNDIHLYVYNRLNGQYGIYYRSSRELSTKNYWHRLINPPINMNSDLSSDDIDSANDVVYFFDGMDTDTQYSINDLPLYEDSSSYTWNIESALPGATTDFKAAFFNGHFIVVNHYGNTYIQTGLVLYTISFDEV